MSGGLSQGPYAAARVGFESVTFRTRLVELTIGPPLYYDEVKGNNHVFEYDPDFGVSLILLGSLSLQE